MNEIKIPKSFMLMGQTITVIMKDDLSFRDRAWGSADPRTNEIQLQPNTHGHDRSSDQIEASFIHEMVHFCLHFGGDEQLSDDEPFVIRLSALIHQALKTAVYENSLDKYIKQQGQKDPIDRPVIDDRQTEHKKVTTEAGNAQRIENEYPH